MWRSVLAKSRKRTYRELQYQKMADGYRLLRSPVADSYSAAAQHYQQADPPIDPPASAEEHPQPADLRQRRDPTPA